MSLCAVAMAKPTATTVLPKRLACCDLLPANARPIRMLPLNELIEQCLNGNAGAENELYARLAPLMFGVCLRYAPNAVEAEDVLQEGFMKMFLHLESYRGQGPLEAWVRRIMVHTALERYRKKALLTVDAPEEDGEELQVPAPAFDDNLSAEMLLELIQALPPGYRLVFNLFAIEGYSHKEIAERLHISEGTSKSQLARARRILQEQVNRLYGFKPHQQQEG
jgi:RNA polymerase sigma factor (sigma-70 family)